MQEASPKSIHMMYGVLLTVIAVVALMALVVLKSQTGGPENATPSISAVITPSTTGGDDSGDSGSAGIALTENTTTTFYIRGTVVDNNGCTEIASDNSEWTAKVYETGAANAGSGATCSTADNNDCYNLTESTLTLSGCTGAGDTDVLYEFALPVQYWTNPSDQGAATWTSRVDVTDSSSATTIG